jgi:hypothetical protein
VVRRFLAIIFLTSVLLLAAFSLLGAGPNQAERPPQPFFQDFFSGTVLLQGSPAPEGTLLIACIDGCEGSFESAPYSLKPDGVFDQLEVNPVSEDLIGHPITFYLVNEYGRIRAVEIRPYIGVFDFYVQDLTFVDPLPLAPVPDPTPRPTPTASLPVAGDPAVAQLPKIALMAGAAAVLVGASLLLVSRRIVA